MKQTIACASPIQPDMSRKGKTHIQWIVTILVNITILSYGLQISWLACVAKVLQSSDSPTGSPLSTVDISWLASSPSLAAMLSVPCWAYLVDRVGRKPCMTSCAVCQVLSWLIIYFARNMTSLMIARVLGGLAGGGCVYIMPMYIKEISQDDIRGILGLVMNTSRNLGILFIYFLGGYFEYYTILYVVLAVAIVGVLAVLKAPESPTYYVKIRQIETAKETTAYFRKLTIKDNEVQNAIDSIKAEDEKFKTIENVTFIGIFKQEAWCKGLVYMILLMLCHGLNGGFSIVNYAPTILDMAQITVNPELQSLSVPIVMIIGSLLSMVFIERLGRKPILVSQFLLALVSFAALAAILVLQRGGTTVPEWVTVSVIAVPVFSYAAAISPMPSVLMAEMFNFQIRAKVMGCLVMVGWAFAFVQVLIFGPMSTTLGYEAPFIFFAVINLIGTFLVLVFFPETKGKSVEQIEQELVKKRER